MTAQVWYEIGRWVGIVFFSAFMVTFFIGSIVLAADKTRRKHFYRSPVGWQVKYWVGEEDRYGTVIDVEGDDAVVIRGTGEPVTRKCDEVNPLYKHK
jgi:hypothetical protein